MNNANKLLYALQVYSGDILEAGKVAELHKLICEKKGAKYTDSDCLLMYQKYCEEDNNLEEALRESFQKVYIFRSGRRETGFPGGPNGVWFSLIQQLAERKSKDSAFNYKCVLTTEPDAIPIVLDWDKKLLEAWDREGMPMLGHLMGEEKNKPGEGCHINGNALIPLYFFNLDPIRFLGCPSYLAWDTYLAKYFKKLGWADIPEIRNLYHYVDLGRSTRDRLLYSGCVWLHGVKDESAISLAREKFTKDKN